MKSYLKNYIDFLASVVENQELSPAELSVIQENLLIQIQFMQHERLIHLIVTLLFSVALFIGLGIVSIVGGLAVVLLVVLLLALLIPYIIHYYFLENSVQKLYYFYNSITNRICVLNGKLPTGSIPNEYNK